MPLQGRTATRFLCGTWNIFWWKRRRNVCASVSNGMAMRSAGRGPFPLRQVILWRDGTLRTACTAVNLSSRAMPVQLGFHPGLRCPFSSEYGIQDYCIRFEKPEISGGTDTLDLTPALFDHDSICFTNLRSDWLQLEERKTGRYLRVYTQGFPYVLLGAGLEFRDGYALSRGPATLVPDICSRSGRGPSLLPPGGSFSRAQKIEIAL